MRLAALDIGSNTVHALVADVVRNRLEEVAHYVEMPELGARVARTGSIGAKGRFAIRALRSVVNRARKDGYDKLLAAATEAVREANDGEAFARQAGEAIGAPVHIISTSREAELSFLGAATYHATMRGGVEALLLLLDWYGLAVLQISHQGLRHGMLLAYLERGDDWWK